MDKNKLMNQIVLMRIGLDNLEAEVAGMPEEPKCPHPPNQRKNLTTMGGPEEWQCKLCGYHYKEGEE